MISSSPRSYFKLAIGAFGDEKPSLHKFQFRPKNQSYMKALRYYQFSKIRICSDEEKKRSKDIFKCVANFIQNVSLDIPSCTERCITPKIKMFMPAIEKRTEFKHCSNFEQEICMDNQYAIHSKIKDYIKKNCPKQCHIKEYEVSSSLAKFKHNTNHNWTIIMPISVPSDKIKVKEEYQVYDFIGMVGTVGGSLGLFIGFSFFDAICYLVDFIALKLKWNGPEKSKVSNC